MSQLNFSKMHALGNDFVFLDGLSKALSLTEENIRLLADRRYGVGCDQVLVCEAPQDMQSDFFMRVYNSDGSESEHCGNGARCFLHYVRQQGLTSKDEIQLQTKGGVVQLSLTKNDINKKSSKQGDKKSDAGTQVRCVMGEPDFNPHNVLRNTGSTKAAAMGAADFTKPLPFVLSVAAAKMEGKKQAVDFEVYPASFGNPHLIIFQQDKKLADKLLAEHGEALATHPQLINGANVGFLSIGKKGLLQLQTYERGAGRTLACGTNASAAYAVAHALGALNPDDTEMAMELPGGIATMGIIKANTENKAAANFQIYMESMVEQVFSSSIKV